MNLTPSFSDKNFIAKCEEYLNIFDKNEEDRENEESKFGQFSSEQTADIHSEFLSNFAGLK